MRPAIRNQGRSLPRSERGRTRKFATVRAKLCAHCQVDRGTTYALRHHMQIASSKVSNRATYLSSSQPSISASKSFRMYSRSPNEVIE